MKQIKALTQGEMRRFDGGIDPWKKVRLPIFIGTGFVTIKLPGGLADLLDEHLDWLNPKEGG